MKKTKLKLVVFFTILLFAVIPSVYAENGTDQPSDVEDGGPDPPPTAPISTAIPLGMLLGVAFAYKTYSKAKN